MTKIYLVWRLGNYEEDTLYGAFWFEEEANLYRDHLAEQIAAHEIKLFGYATARYIFEVKPQTIFETAAKCIEIDSVSVAG